MEMKIIQDYPNYAVTIDGRVYSFRRKRFIYCQHQQSGLVVMLSYDGIRFAKYVRRLVFEAFNGYSPEIVRHKDGDIFNNNIENLVGMSRFELNKIINNRPRKAKSICRVEIATGKLDIIENRKNNKDNTKIKQAVQRKSLTSGGYFYYYPDKKDDLIKEIKAHIYSDELTLNSLLMSDKYNPFIPIVKKHIKLNKKYIEILEGV